MTTIHGCDASDHQMMWQLGATHVFCFGKLYDPTKTTWTRDIYLPRSRTAALRGLYITMGPTEDGPQKGKDKWKWTRDQCAALGIPLDGTWPMFDDMIEFGADPDEVAAFIKAAQNDGQKMGHYDSEDRPYNAHGADWRFVAHYGIYPARPIIPWDLFQHGSAGASGDADLADMSVQEFTDLTTTGGGDDMTKQEILDWLGFTDEKTLIAAVNYAQGHRQGYLGKDPGTDTNRKDGVASFTRGINEPASGGGGVAPHTHVPGDVAP